MTAFHQWELDEDDPRCVTSAQDVSIFAPKNKIASSLIGSQWMKDTLGKASLGGPLPSVRLNELDE